MSELALALNEGGPRVTRVRHELRRRTLTVLRVERPSPGMVRTVLGGPELAGFSSLGFDDHVKLFLPQPGAPAPFPGGPSGQVMRDFTPRRHDAAAGELWIDFVLHQAGPATTWAAQAKPGQTLTVGGPKGSMLIEADDIHHHLLIGDETALPAIGRRLEELPPGARAQVFVEIDPGTRWELPASPATVEAHWVPRDGKAGGPAHELVAALKQASFPKDGCFCWIAGESQLARTLRRHLVEERGTPKRWIKAAGYWQRGVEGAHERIDDA